MQLAAPQDGEPFDQPREVVWGGVLAMTLAVAAIMTAELLPVGLLTLIAHDLKITTGAAGQAITATAISGIAAGLLISPVTRTFNRRSVILAIGVILIASNLLVAFSTNVLFLLLGRVGVGIAHGGLWALVPATGLRLAPADRVPRVLAIIFAGISVAITLATPLGSYLGELVGWRGAFFMAAAVGMLATLLLYFQLPPMAAAKSARFQLPLGLLLEPYIAVGMIATVLVFAGHYSFFTYVRPFIEHLPGMGKGSLPLILFLYGLANFAGVTLGGKFLALDLFKTLIVPPLAMACMALGLIFVGPSPWIACAIVIAWGFVYGMVPVGWNTWVARTNTARVEGAGGLLVACIQAGIALGAAAGGYAFDLEKYAGAFGISVIILLVTAAMAYVCSRLWHRTLATVPPAPPVE